MKQFPKIPNHYQTDVYDIDALKEGEMYVLEKVDGSNFRFIMYDERFHDEYDANILEQEPENKDIVIGLKSSIRGCLSDSVDSFDGVLEDIILHLRNNVDIEKIYEYHTEYNSPLMFFGEFMTPHSLDYDYQISPPPLFIGFEVMVLSEWDTDESIGNPYTETFKEFIHITKAKEIFERIGLEFINIIEAPNSVDPENYNIPFSSYGSVQAEGVVVRNEDFNRRVKIVSEEFRERHETAFGTSEKEAESGSELFVARYCTNARIRKHIHKLGDDISLVTLTHAVIEDAWQEELTDIQNISIPLKPAKIYEKTYQRCIALYEHLSETAEYHGKGITEVWDSLYDYDLPETVEFENPVKELIVRMTYVQQRNAKGIVDELLTTGDINYKIEQKGWNKEISRELISEVTEELTEEFWRDYYTEISHLTFEFTPNEIHQEIQEKVVEVMNNRDDIETPTQNESTTEVNAEGLGEMF